jgi:hypothetical protein
MYCVYCDRDHEDGTQFSDEHIIPVALGGTDVYTIRVCRESNSMLGNRVDDPFISLPFVNSDRYFLGLASHRAMPTLDLSGTSIIGGRDCSLKYTITEDRKVLKIAKPSVKRVKTTDGFERFEVFGDPEDVKRILLGKLASVEEQGKSIRDDFGNVLTRESIEAMISERSVTHPNPSVLLTWQPSAYDAVRFFCKTALAACFYEFGESFGRSDVGKKLRSAMLAEKVEDIAPPGMFWPLVDNTSDVYSFFKTPDAHVIAILPNGAAIFVISLFGGKYTAVIPLQDGPSPSSFVIPKEGRAIQLDLRTRQIKRTSFAEYILRQPWVPAAERGSSEQAPLTPE